MAVVLVNYAGTFFKWLTSPLFLVKWVNFFTFLEQNWEFPFAVSFCSREMHTTHVAQFQESWEDPFTPRVPWPCSHSTHLYTQFQNQYRIFAHFLFSPLHMCKGFLNKTFHEKKETHSFKCVSMYSCIQSFFKEEWKHGKCVNEIWINFL